MVAHSPDPSGVSVAGLMALEPVAARSAVKSASLAERPGTTATPARGQGHEIREIRPFADGDDPRHIDAAATARIGSPQVRSFHEDRERSVMLIADFRRPMLWGTRGRLRSVAAADALALAGWQASLEGGAVGLVALTDLGPEVQAPRPRHRGMALVAGTLARAHAAALAEAQRNRGGGAGTRMLAPDLLRAARQTPRGTTIVLASGLDNPGEGLDEAIAVLAARGPLRLILIEDAFELGPPGRPLPYLGTDGPTFADFSGLAAMRDARASGLSRPGLQVQRLSSSERAG